MYSEGQDRITTLGAAFCTVTSLGIDQGEYTNARHTGFGEFTSPTTMKLTLFDYFEVASCL